MNTQKILLPLMLSLSSIAAHSQPTYKLTAIGDPPTDPNYRLTYVNDMNDQGEIVGQFYGGPTTFLWRDGRLTALPSLNGDPESYSEAFGINDLTEIVGVSTDERQHEVIWTKRQVSDLGIATDGRAFPFKINRSGQIVGYMMVDDMSNRKAFLLADDELHMLPSLPGGAGFTDVVAINEAGVILGSSDSANGFRSVIWTDGIVQEITARPPGATHTGAVAINDLGHITIQATFDSRRRAYVLRDGELVELPALRTGDHIDVIVGGINNQGQVIGTDYDTLTGEQVPVLWQDGVPLDLRDLVRANDPLKPYAELRSAGIINNRGQLVVNGVDTRRPFNAATAYLMTPIPQN